MCVYSATADTTFLDNFIRQQEKSTKFFPENAGKINNEARSNPHGMILVMPPREFWE